MHNRCTPDADAEPAVHALTIVPRIGAEAGLTQAALAERMGPTQSAVARLEGGRVSPTVDTLRKYAKAVGKRLKVEMV